MTFHLLFHVYVCMVHLPYLWYIINGLIKIFIWQNIFYFYFFIRILTNGFNSQNSYVQWQNNPGCRGYFATIHFFFKSYQ